MYIVHIAINLRPAIGHLWLVFACVLLGVKGLPEVKKNAPVAFEKTILITTCLYMRQSTSYFKYNELQIPRGFILCELFNLLLYQKKPHDL